MGAAIAASVCGLVIFAVGAPVSASAAPSATIVSAASHATLLHPASERAAAARGATLRTAAHAVSATTTPIGVDISYPQCTTPASISTRPFAVIGVNGGKASTMNPCFSSEYNSALLLSGATQQPHAAVYLNTGNPGLAAAFWPSANVTQAHTAVPNPKGTCAHKTGASCAFVYGYSMAESDYNTVTVTDGFAAPPLWWLDVETSNSWSATDKKGNSASIEGMQSFLQSKGLKVGIYSTSYQFGKIAGTVLPSSALAGVLSWLAGASSTSAPGDCSTSAPLTPGGRVSLVQYVLGSGRTALDNDYSCGVLSPASPTITGAAHVGTRLFSHHAAWAPVAVSYTYQWFANGAAIPGATKYYHTVTKSELGKKIIVRITGRASGYGPRAINSAATAPVTKTFTSAPSPTITGTLASGHTVTAHHNTWRPGTPSYTYQWYLDGVAIPGATKGTYLLALSDAGNSLRVAVVAREKNYATTTRVSSTVRIAAAR